MTSIYRQYGIDNFPFLERSVLRGEFLYGLKLFFVNEIFAGEQACVLRMRVALACIEARAVVIDAYIQAEKTSSYLFILCSSALSYDLFSQAVKNIIPQMTIEKLYKRQAEMYLQSMISGRVQYNQILDTNEVSAERKLLLSLFIQCESMLIENKKGGLLASSSVIRRHGLLHSASNARKYAGTDMSINLVMFQKNEMILSLPVFQIKKMDKDVFQKKYIQILPEYGGSKIYIDDVFCIKNINMATVFFKKKIEKGVYEVEVAGNTEKFKLNFVVLPTFLQ